MQMPKVGSRLHGRNDVVNGGQARSQALLNALLRRGNNSSSRDSKMASRSLGKYEPVYQRPRFIEKACPACETFSRAAVCNIYNRSIVRARALEAA